MRTAHNTNDGRGALRTSRNALQHTLHATTLRLDPSNRSAPLHRSNPLRLITHYRRILQDAPGAAPFTAHPLAARPSTPPIP
jgi:hypothetical protein